MEYRDFIASKTLRFEARGPEAQPPHEILFPFQRRIVEWAIRKGRAAIFADCGLGKSLMQIEWARQCGAGGQTLLVAPLSVAGQTIAEAARVGVEIARVSEPSEAPFQITNYQKLHRFVGHAYRAIVLDESSILKSLDGKTRSLLLSEFTGIPHRLACTATPAPNDIAELGNHSEFIGALPRVEMLASFFVHDEQTWRLKGHARDAFWRWLASWACYVRKPSDIGEPDDGFTLPDLRIRDEVVPSDYRPEASLFALGGIHERRGARRQSIGARVAKSAEVIAGSPGQWLVWCGLNDEGRELATALGPDAVLIEGSDSDEDKIDRERRWRAGDVRVLICKAAMFGFGMNWQHCRQMLFLGLGDSYEQYYQSIRRCWRFGQRDAVDVVIVTSTAEGSVAANVRRKEDDAARVAAGVVEHMKDAMAEEIGAVTVTQRAEYREDIARGDGWELRLGDCVERVKEIPDASVGLTVFSPPFASLYTYSASDRDMGNARSVEEFRSHFRFLIPELLRVTTPGRRCCVHTQQMALRKGVDGVIGMFDLRATLVADFVAAGWVYDGEVVIDKDPQAQAIRTRSKSLLFVQKNKDSSWSRPAMADYILLFRHPGDNPVPIVPDVSNEEWICWARPIWYGIRESDTLQAAEARANDDERHICPLQLETIERCVRLWSNPGDLVLSPFAGIGSEGVVSVRKGRRFTGVELKPEYWRVAVKNLRGCNKQIGLFDAVGT